jgi:putative DNA primase/helicase
MNPEPNLETQSATNNPATEKAPPGVRNDQSNAGSRPQSALEFPEAEPWPEPVAGQVLLDALERLLRRFVVLPEPAPPTLALWILHTYAFQFRDVSTYLGLESPEKRCGKTTLLTILLELVNRPVVAANISSPAFFRLIEETRPTLLIDEADTLLQGNDELRGILNSGYTRRTAYVVRVANQSPASPLSLAQPATNLAQPSGSRLARFSCWCPKVMAAIGRLPDTLADRCIVIPMQRKTAAEPCERLRNLETTALRRQCARFVLDHGERIARALPLIPPSLNDRAGDVWEPLLVLADLAGGAWPEKARQAAVKLSAGAQEHSPIGALLIEIMLILLGEQGHRIFSRDLVASLNQLPGRPWLGLEMGKGQAITELRLAQQLRPYGIRPASLRLGTRVAKGYREEDFSEAFRRYVPRADFEALIPAVSATEPPAT